MTRKRKERKERKDRDNAEARRTQSFAGERKPRAQTGMDVARVMEESVAPTALVEIFGFVPSPYGLG